MDPLVKKSPSENIKKPANETLPWAPSYWIFVRNWCIPTFLFLSHSAISWHFYYIDVGRIRQKNCCTCKYQCLSDNYSALPHNNSKPLLTSGETQTLSLQCWKTLPSSNTHSGWKVTPGVTLPNSGQERGRPKLYQREMNLITHKLITAITLLINSSPWNLWVAWGTLVLVIQRKMKIPKRSRWNGDCLSVSNFQQCERCAGDIRMGRL